MCCFRLDMSIADLVAKVSSSKLRTQALADTELDVSASLWPRTKG